jgi:hypothetical protein
MKWLLLLLILSIAITALLALAGLLLPRQHDATRQAVFHRPPAELFAIVHDFANGPGWRSGLKTVELLPPRDGHPFFRETSGHGAVTFAVLEDRAPEKLVVQIADDHLPYGGTWTYEFSAVPGGTRMRITEQGEVKNVVFRVLARFVFGYTATIETYLSDLGKKVGENVLPQP